MIKLQAANLDDLEAAGHLLQQAFKNGLPGFYGQATTDELLPILSRPNKHLIETGQMFKAVDAGAIVAIGGWSNENPATKMVEDGFFHVRQFAVHPSHQRRGIARAIFSAIINAFPGRRLEGAYTHATLNSEKAYNSLGFEKMILFHQDIGYTSNVPCVEMLYRHTPAAC